MCTIHWHRTVSSEKKAEDGGKKAVVLSGPYGQRHPDYGGKYSKAHLPQNISRALGHLSITFDGHVSHFSRKAATAARKLNYRDAEKLHSSINRGGEYKGN